jgi:hypothetical protein
VKHRSPTPLAGAALLCAWLVLLGAASPAPAAPAVDRDAAWLAMLRTWGAGIKPARRAMTISVTGRAPRITVRLALPTAATRAATFQDGLYGTYAFAFDGRRWNRVDTADFRSMIAPVLQPGGHATVRLSVRRAAAYRVVVRAPQGAAWVDYTPRP